MVLKLNKCLHDLKQTARELYAKLSARGFQTSAFDPCAFNHHDENIFISAYVDDNALCAASSTNMEPLITELSSEFDLTKLGIANWLLGLHIIYTPTGIAFSKLAYALFCRAKEQPEIYLEGFAGTDYAKCLDTRRLFSG